jgi:hypothetical protein
MMIKKNRKDNKMTENKIQIGIDFIIDQVYNDIADMLEKLVSTNTLKGRDGDEVVGEIIKALRECGDRNDRN